MPKMKTDLERKREMVGDLQTMLEKYKPQIEGVLPSHIKMERLARVALNQAAMENPKLLACTKSSFIGALLEAATLGLEPGVAGECWLVPYKNTATFVLGYRGALKLLRRSGELSTVLARIVYTEDDFELTDMPPSLTHTRARYEDGGFMDEKERGDIIGAYAYVRLRDGSTQFEFMTEAEIMAIAKRSPAFKGGPWGGGNGPHTNEMRKKTVIKRICKVLPCSIEAERGLSLDERADLGLPQHLEVMEAGEDEIGRIDNADATTDDEPGKE